jgi:hypothetical protein
MQAPEQLPGFAYPCTRAANSTGLTILPKCIEGDDVHAENLHQWAAHSNVFVFISWRGNA